MKVYKYLFLILWSLPLMAMSNEELPDPTRPATYVDVDKEPVYVEEVDVKEKINWKLSAIRISADDRTAILNGKLVRVGDDIGPAKILEINPISVVIDHDERKLIVRLFNNQVTKDYKKSR